MVILLLETAGPGGVGSPQDLRVGLPTALVLDNTMQA